MCIGRSRHVRVTRHAAATINNERSLFFATSIGSVADRKNSNGQHRGVVLAATPIRIPKLSQRRLKAPAVSDGCARSPETTHSASTITASVHASGRPGRENPKLPPSDNENTNATIAVEHHERERRRKRSATASRKATFPAKA